MENIKYSLGAGKASCIYTMVGNHDTADKSMKTHSLHWLEGMGINVIDEPWHYGFNGLPRQFSFLPYTEDIEVLKQFFKDTEKKEGGTICFMHQGVAGVPMGSGFVPNEMFTLDMVPDGIEHIFTGHYHQHNTWSDRVTVIGSAMQLNWADKGDKRGFLVFDTDYPSDFEFIETVAPKFVSFNMDGRGSADYTYQEKIGKPGLFDNNFVRVFNYHSQFTEDIREGLMVEAGARSVEFVVEKVATSRLRPANANTGYDIPKLVVEYEQQQGVTEARSKIGKELMK
jgi:DNA repair exonuclease SbcCD nuclease subunit